MKTFNPEKLHEWLITLLLICHLLTDTHKQSTFLSNLLTLGQQIKTALLQEGKGGDMTLLDLIPDFDTVTERLLVFVSFWLFNSSKAYAAPTTARKKS